MDVFAKLGVDWKLLIAQVINFGILFFVLRRYAYKPMLDFLESRTARIDKGLQDAEAAQAKLVSMEEKEKQVLNEARSEARSLIETAETNAKKRDAERLKETEEKTKRFLEDARMKIEEEKQKILLEAKQEIAEVVALSVEKILKEKVTGARDQELIREMGK
ncbi:MAG: F0F1 ATP synthase subunit B [Candidatus Moranbacteria bacterium]|nr:F0F1 ATP synthase subunit B [Candidatus Moranbacteria bacterium]MDD3964495.1 F0F1 ATP synthase subunit B [Candidatus Moranbacteria bacterium]